MTLSDAIVPMVIVAEATAAEISPWAALASFGPLGLWVMWMLYRDNRESAKQDAQHHENQVAMKRIEDAFRTNTDLLIVGLAAMKTIDQNYLALLDRIKASNANSNS